MCQWLSSNFELNHYNFAIQSFEAILHALNCLTHKGDIMRNILQTSSFQSYYNFQMLVFMPYDLLPMHCTWVINRRGGTLSVTHSADLKLS